jgi:hypothetical protein
METPGLELHVIASHRYDSMNRQPHMHPSYYYFGAPDSDSADDNYDLTRECTHIDGTVASDLEAEAADGGGNATPPHAVHPDVQDGAQLLEADQGHNSCRFENCRPSSTRNESACAYFSRPSNRSTWRMHVAEELERELAMSIVASSRTERVNPQSSTEPARTSSPPPCFSATCLSHLHPRLGGPMMRFKVSSRLRPCNRPRVLP